MNHNQLIEYFAQVIQEIFARVGNANNLTDDKNAQKLISAVLKSLDILGVKANEVMPHELEKAYLEAVNGATKELAAQNVKVDKLESTEILKRKIHLAALKRVVSDAMTDLKTAIRTAKKSAKTTIAKTLSAVKKEIAKGLVMGSHNKYVSKRLAKTFQEQGLTSFVTSDGKKLRLDKYAKTVVSYKMREASTQGSVNCYQESGVTLIKISEHGASCAKCGQYAGKVMSIDGEYKGFPSAKSVPLPPYHPHCRHTVSSYVVEYKSDKEIQAEKDKWKGFKEGTDTRTEAQKKAYAKEQEIRRKAHAELKAYERYRAVLGKDAPKTIGAFRRIKRSGGKSWQKLQLAYRQANRELKVE